MAAVNTKGTNATLVGAVGDAKTLQPYFAGGRQRQYYDVEVVNAFEVGSTIKMCYAVPKGAWIMGGKLIHGALGAGVTLSVGVVGVSGTTYDNDADSLLTAGYSAATAGQQALPGAVGNATPYQVTDPEGAFVVITTAGATTAASDISVKVFIDVVQD